MKTIDKIFYEEKYIAEIENKGRKFVSAKNEVRTLSGKRIESKWLIKISKPDELFMCWGFNAL